MHAKESVVAIYNDSPAEIVRGPIKTEKYGKQYSEWSTGWHDGGGPFIFLITYVLLRDIYHIFLYLCYIYFYYYIHASICTELPIPGPESVGNGLSVAALWKVER